MIKRLMQLILLVIMIFGLVQFGSVDWHLNNLGDLSVDAAFQLAQPYFIEQHLQFGEQVVFTYGPWGVLLTAFTGSTYHTAVLLFRIALVVCIFLALCVLAERYSDRNSRIVTWVGAFALVLLWITGQRDSYFLFPALLVTYQRLTAGIVNDEDGSLPVRQSEHLLWIALSLLSGWAALAKFNIFVVSTIAHLLILTDDVNRRRWPVLPFMYAAALLLAWLSAGQNIANLPLWVFRCLDLSNGYADAMAMGFFVPYGPELVAIYYGAVALIMLTGVAVAALHRWRLPALLILLFTLFLCAVSIKHGMGGNQVEQSLAELAPVLWFMSQLLLLPSGRSVEQDMSLWGRIGLAAAVTGLLCLALVAAKINFPIVSLQQAMEGMRGNASFLATTLRGVSTDKWDATLTGLHRFWEPSTLPIGQTIDVYPQQTGLVIGRKGLHYSPRPAFLSLNAHTSALALLNARHLEESTAPDLILFQVLPSELGVNNRYPALADGPSWPLLLSRYDLTDFSSEFLVLSKRSDRLQPERPLIVERKVALDEQVALPHTESGLVWAEIDIKRTFLGKLIHMVYKSPHVIISTHTADNIDHTYQLVPELGKAGFLLSPLVEDTSSFAQIQRRGIPSRDTVKLVRISSPDAPIGFWASDITLRLFDLLLPTTALPSLPPDAQRLMSLQFLDGNTTSCLFPPRLEQLNGTKQQVLALHAPCQTEVAVSPTNHSMTIRFGLQDSSFSGPAKTDGVIVQVVGLKSDGKEYSRWIRTLDPETDMGDRGIQQMTISWQDTMVERIVIKLLAGVNNDPSYDHSYIQDIIVSN